MFITSLSNSYRTFHAAETRTPLWKTVLVALLILNPAAVTANYCPVAYSPVQQLCPANGLPPPAWDEIHFCMMISSSSDQEKNLQDCKKTTLALQPYNEWREAAENEDLKKVQSLCDYGLDLEWALRQSMEQVINTDLSQHAIFETLLQAGADPDQIYKTRYFKPYKAPTLTHIYRYKKERVDLIDLFLKYGASPLVKDSYGMGAIDHAIENNEVSLVEKFLAVQDEFKVVTHTKHQFPGKKMVELLQRHQIEIQCSDCPLQDPTDGLSLFTGTFFRGIYDKPPLNPAVEELRKVINSVLSTLPWDAEYLPDLEPHPSYASMNELENELRTGLAEIRRRPRECCDDSENHFAILFVDMDLRIVEAFKEKLANPDKQINIPNLIIRLPNECI